MIKSEEGGYMKWFIDLSTRGKLFVSFGLMIVLLAIVLVTAYRYLTQIQNSQRTIYEVEFANAADLKDVRFYQEGIQGRLADHDGPQGPAASGFFEEFRG